MEMEVKRIKGSNKWKCRAGYELFYEPLSIVSETKVNAILVHDIYYKLI